MRNRRCHSKSGYLGVSIYTQYKSKRKYIKSTICINGINIHLGYFKNPKDAAKAYDKRAKEVYGEFANLNFK